MLDTCVYLQDSHIPWRGSWDFPFCPPHFTCPFLCSHHLSPTKPFTTLPYLLPSTPLPSTPFPCLGWIDRLRAAFSAVDGPILNPWTRTFGWTPALCRAAAGDRVCRLRLVCLLLPRCTRTRCRAHVTHTTTACAFLFVWTPRLRTRRRLPSPAPRDACFAATAPRSANLTCGDLLPRGISCTALLANAERLLARALHCPYLYRHCHRPTYSSPADAARRGKEDGTHLR